MAVSAAEEDPRCQVLWERSCDQAGTRYNSHTATERAGLKKGYARARFRRGRGCDVVNGCYRNRKCLLHYNTLQMSFRVVFLFCF
ncbi:hypothetical protein FKM82_022359 [Ascaphus truei]